MLTSILMLSFLHCAPARLVAPQSTRCEQVDLVVRDHDGRVVSRSRVAPRCVRQRCEEGSLVVRRSFDGAELSRMVLAARCLPTPAAPPPVEPAWRFGLTARR